MQVAISTVTAAGPGNAGWLGLCSRRRPAARAAWLLVFAARAACAAARDQAPSLGGGGTYPTDYALSCPSAGNCTLGGTYVSKRDGVQPYVATEKHGTWGPAQPLPGVAALNSGKIGGIAGLVCFSAGTCTAAGGYGIRTKSRFVGAIYVTAEKNGKWGRPERVPGSAALGTDVILATLSCGAPGNCSVGGSYGGKNSDEPFLATEKNGTWGHAETVPGIQP